MIKSAQYFFIVFLFLILYSLFFIPSASAQVIPNNTNPDVPNNLHTWTQSLMIEITSSLSCMLAGVDPINPKGQCLGIDSQTHKIGYVQGSGGAIGIMGGLIATTFTPPAHTSDFVRYLSRNFGIAKPAYADNGIGFTGLLPLLGIWTVFRNITYLLFVIVFIIIGFAIMLRIHIDPRTVMTIENQIPKIIVALILVTFSFAIAGFLIDLMYVLIYMSFGIFSQVPGVGDSLKDLNPTLLQGKNALEAAGGVGGIAGISNTLAGYIKDLIGNFMGFNDPSGNYTAGALIVDTISGVIATFTGIQIAQIPTPSVFGFNLGTLAGAPLGIVAGGAAFFAAKTTIINILPYLIAYLVIFIALLFALFRLWFTLIKAYVFLLIDVVFAPFWIIAGLIPGGNLNFIGWLRDICGNLIAFPATIVMFLLGKAFIAAFSTPVPTGQQPFFPPLIGNPGDPSIIGALIGFGIILMTPTVVDMMKAWVKAPKFDISAISQAVGVGTGAVNPLNMIARGTQFGSTLYWAHQTPVLSGILGRMGIKPRGGGPAAHTPP